MLVQTFHNLTQQTVSALKQFQCQRCTTGRNNSTNHCLFMQSWSEPFLFYKPAIFSLLPNISLCCSFHTSTMKSMQNWSDSICKPVISILNLARTSLQTSDLHSSSFIYHMWCSFWISTMQCTHHSSPVIPHSAVLISKLFLFFRNFEFSFKSSFQINPASSPTPPCPVLP